MTQTIPRRAGKQKKRIKLTRSRRFQCPATLVPWGRGSRRRRRKASCNMGSPSLSPVLGSTLRTRGAGSDTAPCRPASAPKDRRGTSGCRGTSGPPWSYSRNRRHWTTERVLLKYVYSGGNCITDLPSFGDMCMTRQRFRIAPAQPIWGMGNFRPALTVTTLNSFFILFEGERRGRRGLVPPSSSVAVIHLFVCPLPIPTCVIWLLPLKLHFIVAIHSWAWGPDVREGEQPYMGNGAGIGGGGG